MANKAALIILWIAYLLLAFFISYATDSRIDLVFIGTLPILLYLIVFAGFLLERKSFVIWIAPLVFPLIFLGVWSSQGIALLNQMDGPQLAVFDILVSYAITILGVMFYGKDSPEKKSQKPKHMAPMPQYHQQRMPNHPAQRAPMQTAQKHMQPMQRVQPVPQGQVQHPQKAQVHHQMQMQKMHQQNLQAQQRYQQQMQQAHNQYTAHLNQYHQQNQQYSQEVHKLRRQVDEMQQKQQVTKENLQLNLKGIEDKCKAINFVIGRVYSDKKGGSKEIRDAIHIPRELYNSFSELSKEMKQEHLAMVLKILEAVHKKLLQMELPENQLFSIKKNARIEIKRRDDGSDKILTVLAANDQDPIAEYHKEAKEICSRLSEFLRKSYR